MASLTKKPRSGSTRYLRRMLEEKSTELRAQLKSPATNPILHAAGDPYDTADWAERSHEEWIFVQKNSFDMALLREIEDALERLRERSYGTCMDCDVLVSRKRLEAVPWARYCVPCQERRNPLSGREHMLSF